MVKLNALVATITSLFSRIYKNDRPRALIAKQTEKKATPTCCRTQRRFTNAAIRAYVERRAGLAAVRFPDSLTTQTAQLMIARCVEQYWQFGDEGGLPFHTTPVAATEWLLRIVYAFVLVDNPTLEPKDLWRRVRLCALLAWRQACKLEEAYNDFVDISDMTCGATGECLLLPVTDEDCAVLLKLEVEWVKRGYIFVNACSLDTAHHMAAMNEDDEEVLAQVRCTAYALITQAVKAYPQTQELLHRERAVLAAASAWLALSQALRGAEREAAVLLRTRRYISVITGVGPMELERYCKQLKSLSTARIPDKTEKC
ncbi:MAG: uncharacterized protein KVP18_002402 [Porospora cf. gigantea A]|uniref:uncharacterized protein n=1 Tax=Porospora cf. gigantea A TaxID=2853593 RepID=UPI003559450D|nr:MAG: hypothetical protein KVP18_002402 [Porospora cf. gigantea A]